MGFLWPTGKNTKIIFDLWHFGTASISPYKNIVPKYDLLRKECRIRRARSATIMKAISDLAILHNKIKSEKDLNTDNGSDIFNFCYTTLINSLYTDITGKRLTDLTIDSVYEKYRKSIV
jgi:hypothetical protein